jgi:hypothetical protein
VGAVLDFATRGSAWRALELQDELNVTILKAMEDTAAGRRPATVRTVHPPAGRYARDHELRISAARVLTWICT